MTQYSKFQREYVALIFKDGHIEVKKASNDIKGRVFFTHATKAFKVATELVRLGLITVKRDGDMLNTSKEPAPVGRYYYLGAYILPAGICTPHLYAEEVLKSKRIHEVCYARS